LYEPLRAGGPEALADKPSRPDRARNRTPDNARDRLVHPTRRVPTFAVRVGSAVHRRRAVLCLGSPGRSLAKAHDPITSPTFIAVTPDGDFHDKTPGSNQFWQTGFTYLKVIGWGWFNL
jgi:putative transposase